MSKDVLNLNLNLEDIKTILISLGVWFLTTTFEKWFSFLSSIDIKITLEISGKNLSVIAFVLLFLLICFLFKYFNYNK
ncbi:hypothetical protein [Mammaliicoccus sciuri]|uniref:hypothetical protein n=1 Tax=Mammaliicoccus sciuri TaxID=1296 RepID=UPI002DB8C797|nr:hypothetical protein [Mammaliicoccus sciuri]MEB7735297.1 hypothetical protein [Mammaliicoccus sciuri]